MKQREFHLVAVISGHGFGHVAMTAPVINALRQRLPGLRLTIKSNAPPWLLRRCFAPPFTLDERPSDFGMVMHDAFTVDTDLSYRAYDDAHRHWSAKVREEQDWLKAIKADLVLSNIAYRPLLAARYAGIPAIGVCCLNWADLFRHYFEHRPGANAIYQHILEAYAAADLFLRPMPAMPMAALQTQAIGPIARVGEDRYHALVEMLKLPATTRFALASLGGIPTTLQCQQWPKLDDVHYLVPEHSRFDRPDMSALEPTGISFPDAMRASAVLITKPGYGSFAEAACNATPVLFAHRDWPEQPYLVEWLEQRLPCHGVTPEQLARGDFETPLSALLSSPRPKAMAPNGIADAITRLTPYFDR